MPLIGGEPTKPTIEDAMAFIEELNDGVQALRAEVEELRRETRPWRLADPPPDKPAGL